MGIIIRDDVLPKGSLMPTVVFVIAQDVFRDEEYAHPREVLERRGARVVSASVAPGTAHGRFGLHIDVDMALSDVDPAEFDGVVFVGGAGAAVFFDDPVAHHLARTMLDAKKTVAAICIAASTLARAGLLRGVRATAYGSQEADLRSHGAIWTGNPIEVDGTIITANGPEAAADFGSAIADALGLAPDETGGIA